MYSRRPKESHRDTIQYEIEMLIFCAESLPVATTRQNERLAFVLLEGFLLHYRNLLRVFSGENARLNDLSINTPEVWGGRALSDDENRTIRQPGKRLDDKDFETISKYLQHCTVARYEVDQDWDVEAMLSEMRPILTAFEAAFPAR